MIAVMPYSSHHLVKHLLTLCAIAIFVATSCAGATTCTTPTIQTMQGPVCGLGVQTSSGKTADAFLGIPFAETTAQENRWQPPVPKRPWQAVKPATQFGDICPQTPLPFVSGTQPTSEDCLSINVWRPKGVQPGASLPVMAFIYGGNFDSGSGSAPGLDGAFLAANRDVMVVNFNYRVGALGFLVYDEISGNYGVLDQQLALKWIQQNIAAFGGDPTQVTLFGQSAGAISVMLHLVSAPGSQDLFRAAIVESDPASVPFRPQALANQSGTLYAEGLGCQDLSCLQGKTANEIVAAQANAKLAAFNSALGIQGSIPWIPSLDGTIVTRQRLDAVAAGALKKPLIIGTNLNEGTLFVALLKQGLQQQGILPTPDAPINIALYEGMVNGMFGTTNGAKVLQTPAYQGTQTGDNTPILSQLNTDYLFTCSTRFIATHASDDRYLYQFTHVSSFDIWKDITNACKDQVCHGDELPYVFHSADEIGATFTAAEATLSTQIEGYWSSFATALAPNTSDTAQPWPSFLPQKTYLVLNTQMATATDPFASTCAFWDTIGYELPPVHQP